MKSTVQTLLISILLSIVPLQLLASERVALIIGNADYNITIGKLANPVNDAKSLTSTLEELGFKVLYKPNLETKEEMEIAVEEFSSQISEANIALFYYSGHGVQQNGNNYLMPTQAIIKNPRHIRHKAMNVSFLMDEMTANTRGLSLVILDACRDNPYPRSSRSSATRGLARMSTPSETIIAYATEPGATAADGIGNHSPYAAQLLNHLKPYANLPIVDVINKVNVAVADATNNKQIPGINMSPLRNLYCFSQCASTMTTNTFTESVPTAPIIVDTKQEEISYWNSIKDSNNPAYYSAYLTKFGGNGIYSTLAIIKLHDFSQPANLPSLPDNKQRAHTQRVDSYLEKGRMYLYNKGRPKKALNYFNKALSLDKQNKQIYYELGAANIKLFEYAEAIQHLKAAIRLDPKYTAAYKKLGDSYSALGDDAKAAYYKQYYYSR